MFKKVRVVESSGKHEVNFAICLWPKGEYFVIKTKKNMFVRNIISQLLHMIVIQQTFMKYDHKIQQNNLERYDAEHLDKRKKKEKDK